MNKEYVYRKHLQNPLKFLATIILGFLGMFIVIGISITLNLKEDRFEFFGIFFIVGIIALFIVIFECLIMYFIVLRRFKNINIKLTDDEIVYNNIKGKDIISYKDIVGIKFSEIKYIGGWIKIIHKTGNIRLTVVLENIGEFSKELKNKLDSLGYSNLYKEKSMFNFYKTAKYADESWERVYKYINKFVVFVVVNIVFCSLCLIIGNANINILWRVIFLPLIPYAISEIIFVINLSKRIKDDYYYEKIADKVESKILKYAFGIYSFIFVIISLIMCLT